MQIAMKNFKKFHFKSWPEKLQWFVHFTCGWSKLRRAVSVKYKMNFKDLLQKKKKEYKVPPVFLDIDYMLKW